ncbi:hypothetical protein [Asticcacaulis excentricus]|uniref:hypothetical protein n=1 Tax=Asticcacaulis excentricus TaxID=78587 RepID=UPI000F818431|nr:hypothetical protein [Asticcacaulis excentricus]
MDDSRIPKLVVASLTRERCRYLARFWCSESEKKTQKHTSWIAKNAPFAKELRKIGVLTLNFRRLNANAQKW